MAVTLTVLRDITPEDKLAPQMKAIVDAIVETVGLNVAVPRQSIIEKLTLSGALNTRQDPARVVGFYMPRLKDKGLVAVTADAAGAEGTAAPKKPRNKKEAEPTLATPPAEVPAEAVDGAEATA